MLCAEYAKIQRLISTLPMCISTRARLTTPLCNGSAYVMANDHFSDLPLFAQQMSGQVSCLPTTIPSEALMKTCTQCRQTKHVEQFYRQKYLSRHGAIRYLAECKDCWKKRVRARHLKHGDTIRTQANARGRWKRGVIKEAVFQAYGGWRCACCGETERLFLSLDHIENNGAAVRRELFGDRKWAGYRTYDYLFRHDFPPGYQVLCMNCQHGKLMNRGICPHQGPCNDYPVMGVESSDSKRATSLFRSGDGDIVCSVSKEAAALVKGRMRK